MSESKNLYKCAERAGRIDSRLIAFMRAADVNFTVGALSTPEDITLDDVYKRLARIETRLVKFMVAAGLDPVTGEPEVSTQRETNALRHHRREMEALHG